MVIEMQRERQWKLAAGSSESQPASAGMRIGGIRSFSIFVRAKKGTTITTGGSVKFEFFSGTPLRYIDEDGRIDESTALTTITFNAGDGSAASKTRGAGVLLAAAVPIGELLVWKVTFTSTASGDFFDGDIRIVPNVDAFLPGMVASAPPRGGRPDLGGEP